MRMTMSVKADTLWSNQVALAVEAEADNPHTQTTEHLATLMTSALRVMFEEAVRGENERAAAAFLDLNKRHRQLDKREHELDEREHAVEGRQVGGA